jgi:DNA mismatch repair protein MutL
MTGRYAVAFLFLELPPDHVDVNVHPTKAEVRFRDANAVHHLVFTAIRDRLRAANLTARLQVPSTILPPRSVVGGSLFTGEPRGEQGEAGTSGQRIVTPPENLPQLPPTSQTPSQIDVSPIVETPQSAGATAPLPTTFSPPTLDPASEDQLPQAPSQAASPPLSHVPLRSRAIQLYDTYLVVETQEGMLVIDQHALHERIMFEQLKRRLREGTLETQRLLIPEPVELTAEQSARTLEHKDELATLGLHVEDFGGGTVLLSSYPAMLERRSPETILRTVVDHLMTQDRLPSREVLLNDLLSLMACHSAVRAGDRLTPEQIDALIEQRHLVDDTHHCPHGRPTALLFSRQELERQFGRI